MCGIVGLLNLNSDPQTDPKLVRTMATQLAHRGQDDEGMYIDGPVAFGFRRLSIIDVDGGHQPLANEDHTIWCMLNGEIYNFVELRQTLRSKGHQFRTKGDTETIVHAYEEYGLDFVEHLRGMFAVAIWDRNRRRLILARDRIGMKPLFYSIRQGELAFSSELKGLLPWPKLEKRLDYGALQDYLRFLYIPAPRSIFATVSKLMPGYMLVASTDSNDFILHRYWSFEIGEHSEQSEMRYAQDLRELLIESVRLRLRSDVALGCFLSGGVDSSAVAALMLQVGNHSGPPLTFSIGFDDAAFDESHYARLVAEHLGTDHHELRADPITPELLEKIVWHLDEPFGDASALPTYLLCQAARQHVTVALSGDGGDELFAGYDRYRYFRWTTLLHSLPLTLRETLIHGLGRTRGWGHRVHPGVARFIRRMTKALTIANLPIELQPFAHNQYFDGETIKQMVRTDLREALSGPSLEDEVLTSLTSATPKDSLDWFLYLDTILGLPDDMLVKVDRMSMAVGLEVRCPLLDQEIVEYAGQIPSRFKLSWHQSKSVFKKSIKDLVPASILTRPKQGFDLPLGSWLDSTFSELMLDSLSEETLRRRGIFEPSTLRNELSLQGSDRYVERPDISSHQLNHRRWASLMFELWAKQYLD